jgi:hypothetical protein
MGFGSPFEQSIFKTMLGAPVQRMSANPFQPTTMFPAVQTMTSLCLF